MKNKRSSEPFFNDEVIKSILAIVFGRLVINISKRFPYPFVSAHCRQFQSAG